MKTQLTLVLTFIIFTTSCTTDIKTTDSNWTTENAAMLVKKSNDSTYWNLDMLNEELAYVDMLKTLDVPFILSPFPVPDYETAGNGNFPIKLKLEDKQLIGHAATVYKNDEMNHLFNSDTTDALTYFSIITIATNNNEHVIATSRNHPNYVAQGSLNIGTESNVDWVAFQTPNKGAFAIVNGKFFDLEFGKTILCAPRKDGSVRFYQFKDLTIDKENLTPLLSNNIIKSFFLNYGNI